MPTTLRGRGTRLPGRAAAGRLLGRALLRLDAGRHARGLLASRDLDGGQSRDRPPGAREPLRTWRELLDVLEDVSELDVVEGLLLEEREGETVEDLAVRVEHLVRLVVRLLDECAHLLVDAL